MERLIPCGTPVLRNVVILTQNDPTMNTFGPNTYEVTERW
jgi:hypothetical protein